MTQLERSRREEDELIYVGLRFHSAQLFVGTEAEIESTALTNPAARLVLRAIQETAPVGTEPIAVSVRRSIEDAGELGLLAAVEGFDKFLGVTCYEHAMASMITNREGLTELAVRIRRNAERDSRRDLLARIGAELIERSRNAAGEDLDELPGLFSRRIEDESSRAAPTATRTILDETLVGHALDAALERLRRRASGAESPLRTPWPMLNRKLGGGFWPGQHFLVGNTGSGKSQLALQLAVESAAARYPVAYVALELGRFELQVRMLALLDGQQSWSRFYTGQASLEDLEQLIERRGAQLAKLPIRIIESGPHGWSYEQINTIARAMRTEYPDGGIPGSLPFLIVLDFLQVVGSPEGRREDLRERIARAAYAARRAAKDHDAVVLVLSGTARENYEKLTNDGKKQDDKLGNCSPARFVGLGKEAGETEYSADTVLVLGRETNSVTDGGPSVMHLGLAKQRAGVPAWVHLRFDGSRFTSIDDNDRGNDGSY